MENKRYQKVYGQWSGNPKGNEPEYERCACSVMGDFITITSAVESAVMGRIRHFVNNMQKGFLSNEIHKTGPAETCKPTH